MMLAALADVSFSHSMHAFRLARPTSIRLFSSPFLHSHLVSVTFAHAPLPILTSNCLLYSFFSCTVLVPMHTYPLTHTHTHKHTNTHTHTPTYAHTHTHTNTNTHTHTLTYSHTHTHKHKHTHTHAHIHTTSSFSPLVLSSSNALVECKQYTGLEK